MKLFSSRVLASQAVRQFPLQLPKELQKISQLESLGDNPDPLAVDEIIGNDCWTTYECDTCRKRSRSGVFAASRVTCLACLRAAMPRVRLVSAVAQ